MTDQPGRPKDCPAKAAEGTTGPASLVADWITIWQSELSAAATDPEMLQAWRRLLALWAANANAAARFIPAGLLPGQGARGGSGHDKAAGGARAEPSAGSAPADAAPDARDAAIERLVRRVEELERRLAGLDQPGHPDGRT